ncbi:MAG: ABC transporter ATP-binding protein [Veillonella caviae]|uniref:ABC transporter ATP-binding protein n=1 Tax=Veillonella caviae TaxID=248316 RepID=UPI002A91CF91|nr:ABC transporter ATP-binding protein [Veillonella caviae]MDY5481176.1 ABC transporter ATP-binding protein [Veillonella caviae]
MKLDIQHISVSLEGQPIVKAASFGVHSGEFVGIIGPNGSGKTTLLKTLRGLYPIDSGSILWDGQALSHLKEKEIARQVAYMQQSIDISFDYEAQDIVMTARYPYLKWWQQEGLADKAIVEQVMKEVGVWHLRNCPIQSLSGGERQRVFLAKALAQQTDVLLLDEPTAALDLVYADDIFHEGRRLCEEGKTILVVVHDLELAAKYCTKLVLIAEGEIVAVGTPKEVLTADYLYRTFHLASAVYEDPYFKQQRIYIFPKGTTDITPYQRQKVSDGVAMSIHIDL